MSSAVQGLAAGVSVATILFAVSFLVWWGLARLLSSPEGQNPPRVTRSPVVQLRLYVQFFLPTIALCAAGALRYVDAGGYSDLLTWGLKVGAPVAIVFTSYQLWGPRAFEHPPRGAELGLTKALQKRVQRITRTVVGASVLALSLGSFWAGTPPWDDIVVRGFDTYKGSAFSFDYPEGWALREDDAYPIVNVTPQVPGNYYPVLEAGLASGTNAFKDVIDNQVPLPEGDASTRADSPVGSRSRIHIPGATKAFLLEYRYVVQTPTVADQPTVFRQVVARTADGDVVWFHLICTEEDARRFSGEFDRVLRSLTIS